MTECCNHRRRVEVVGHQTYWKGWYLGLGGTQPRESGGEYRMLVLEDDGGKVQEVHAFLVKFIPEDK